MARNILFKFIPGICLLACVVDGISQPLPCISTENGLQGWTYTTTTVPVCSGNGIRFTKKNQYLITPRFTNPLKMTFSKRRSGDPTPWELKIQIAREISGPWTDIAALTDVTTICTPAEINLTSFTGAFFLRFEDNRDDGEHHRFLDDIKIYCSANCPPAHAVTDFTPKTGPAGTSVTIRGHDFPAAVKVFFGGIESPAFKVKDDSTVVAKIPGNAPDGKITVTADGCKASSDDIFHVIEKRNCSNGKSRSADLFISETYHDFASSISFIEIFNDTQSNIDFAQHQYTIKTDKTEIPLTGTITAGSTFLLKIGTGTGCGEIIPQQTVSGTLVAIEEIHLLKNSTLIDRVITPNFDEGFRQLRLPESTAPNQVFVEADWITTEEPLCGHLGVSPYSAAANSNNIKILTQPADKTGCSDVASFSIEAAGSGSLNYTWYYNDPTAMSEWGLVSSLSISPNYYTVSGAGTPAISISGPTSALKNYQFYVDIRAGSPQCITASKAVHYDYPSEKYYRTRKSGDWSAEENWEMTNDQISWKKVCNYPSVHNCQSISIQQGHDIVLDIKNSVPFTFVESNATLKIGEYSKLEVHNSTVGADFIIEGTLYDSTGSTNSHVFLDGATWQLGNSATVIKTNSGSVATYRDHYEGGIQNIPATAHWVKRYIGKGFLAVSTTNMFYPNLIIESTSGEYDAGVRQARFTGKTGTMTVKGNLDIGGTASGTVKVYYENEHTLPFEILGNLTVRQGSTFTNSGDLVGTGVNIRGDLFVDGTLTMNGGVQRKGVIAFSGPSAQTVTGIGKIEIQDLEVNNTGVLSVQKSLEVAGALTFGGEKARLSLSNADITMLSGEYGTASVGPVQNKSILSYDGTGRFIVERYIPEHPKAWQLLAVPTIGSTIRESWQENNVQGMSENTNKAYGEANQRPGYGTTITSNRTSWRADGFDAFTGPGPSMKTYDPEQNVWVGVNSTHGKINDFNAYMLMVRGDRSVIYHDQPATPVTLRTRGFLKAPGIHEPEPVAVPMNSFVLVGNPYASAIDYNQIEGTNLNDSYIIWDPRLTSSEYSTYGLGAYRTVSASAGVAVPSGGNYTDGKIPPIQSGQAFFVQSDNLSPGKLQFTETAKVPGSVSVLRGGYFKNPTAQIRTNLFTAKARELILIDGTLMQFHEQYNEGFDHFDARKVLNNGESMAILNRKKAFAIERKPPPVSGDSVFYQISNLKRGNYAIEFVLENMNRTIDSVVLLDDYLHTETLLLSNGKDTIYFSVDDNKLSYTPNRFSIVFPKTKVRDPFNFLNFSVNLHQHSALLTWEVENEQRIYEYAVERSLNGTQFIPIGVLSALNGERQAYTFTDVSAQPGETYYRLAITDLDNMVTYSKVLKINIPQPDEEVKVYIGSENRIQLLLESAFAGKYKINLFQADGRCVLQKVFMHRGTSGRYSFKTKKAAVGIYILQLEKPTGKSWIKRIWLE